MDFGTTKKTTLPLGLQQDLFEITDGRSNTEFRVYTNILELWDLLPKYDPQGTVKRYHPFLSTEESIRKIPVQHPVHRAKLISDESAFVDLELQITPARIETRVREWIYITDDSGKKKRKRVYKKDAAGNYVTEAFFVYPGLREDKVEEALKFLLSRGQGDFDTDRTGVTFSIQQLRKELERTGTKLSLEEIKEALEVLSKSHCEIHGLNSDGKRRSLMSSSFLPQLVMVTREDFLDKRKENGKNLKHCYAQFHVAVTISIKANQFRITHYEKHQRLNTLLSRFIHKILRTEFVNASKANRPFELPFKKLMSEYGRAEIRADSNTSVLETALEDLAGNSIAKPFEVDVLRPVSQSVKTKYFSIPFEVKP